MGSEKERRGSGREGKAWWLNFTNSHYGATVIYLLLMHSSMHLKQYLCPHGVTQASSMRDMHIGQWKCS